MIELNINENGSYSEFLKKKSYVIHFLMVVYDYDLILLNNYQSLT